MSKKKNMPTFFLNQAIPRARHFNSATKPPCALLPGVYSSDTAEMKERGWRGGAGAVGADGRRGEEEGRI